MKVIKPYKFLPKKEIECRATDVLMHVQAKRKRPLKFPLDAGHLAEALGLNMDCGKIPPDEQGAIPSSMVAKGIAAMILPIDRKIVINENSLEFPPGFEESCTAHEIGHWELHIDQNAVQQVEEMKQDGK